MPISLCASSVHLFARSCPVFHSSLPSLPRTAMRAWASTPFSHLFFPFFFPSFLRQNAPRRVRKESAKSDESGSKRNAAKRAKKSQGNKNRRAGGRIKRVENGQKEMRTIQNIIIGTEVRTNWYSMAKRIGEPAELPRRVAESISEAAGEFRWRRIRLDDSADLLPYPRFLKINASLF